jgi:SAM-dependent methyltransferase
MAAASLTHYQLQEVFEWDVRTWSVAYHLWEPHLRALQTAKGLELGGRRGGLSLMLALHGIQATCSDLHNPENIARPLHKKHAVTHLVDYAAINALEIPDAGQWDVIVFKSMVGALGRVNGEKSQKEVFEQIYRALKPGGILLYAENLAGSKLHRVLRKAFVPWGKNWRYPTLLELQNWQHPFELMECRTTGFLSAFGRSEKQRCVLARLDALILPLCPSSWRYVAYGVAYKPHAISR